MRGTVRTMLGQGGIDDVHPVANAAAIRKLEKRPFDLILCDYALGEGQDSQHLLENLRTRHLIPLSTVFIMVTGESRHEKVVSAVELAPNGHQLKTSRPMRSTGIYISRAAATPCTHALRP